MKQLRLKAEAIANGIVVTDEATGEKQHAHNIAKVRDQVASFVSEQTGGSEPGVYYGVTVTITKGRLQKPKGK